MRQLKITKQITSRETKSLTSYLSEVSRVSSVITSEEEVELAKRIKNGDEKAFDALVKANLRFVISVAKQYQRSGANLDDLINEGNIGLIIAARRFDYTRGFKFISYAVWWIRQSISSYLSESSRIVRLPGNKVGMIVKIKRNVSSLEQSLSREPSFEEIVESFKGAIKGSDINQLLMSDQHPSSLDMPLGPDSDNKLSDMIVEEDGVEVDSKLQIRDKKIKVDSLLKCLTPHERLILISFYGLDGEAPRSLAEIGIKLDLTRERIRQIKVKSLRKLNHRLRNHSSIKEYL